MLLALCKLRGERLRYLLNHDLIADKMTRSEFGRHIGMTGQAISKTLKAIEKIHPLEGFFEGKKLSATGIRSILSYICYGSETYTDIHLLAS